MKKVVRVSQILKWSSMVFCLALPLAEAGYWITDGYPFFKPWINCDLVVFKVEEFSTELSSLTNLQKLLGFLINMLPLMFSMVALAYLAKLFGAFEKLEFFEKQNVRILRKAGWALVWGQIIYPFYLALFSLAVTYGNPVGNRNISIGFGPNQFKILAIGLSILLISWVFEEGVKMREEQEATV